VTSGTRTALSQAEANYGQLIAGADIVSIYANKDIAKKLETLYQEGTQKGTSEDQIIQQMAHVVQENIDKGIFFSNHLRAGAVDIRSFDMDDNEKEIFKNIIDTYKDVTLLEEGKPPHWHLDIKV
jgi:hypothetical protein